MEQHLMDCRKPNDPLLIKIKQNTSDTRTIINEIYSMWLL